MKRSAFVLGLSMLILLSGCGKTASPGETVVPHASDASSSVNDPKHPGLVPRDDYGKIFPYVGRLKKSARTPVKIQSFWDGRDSLLYGFIDQNGNIICEPFYDDVELLTYGNKYAYLLTYSTGEPDYTTCYAIAGADGSFVYEYSATEFDYYSFFDGVSLHSKPSELYYKETDAYEYIPVVKDGKWGVIDYDGKQILPYSYLNAPLFNEGLAAVMENDGESYYYIDSSGAKILGPYSANLDFFYENLKSFVFYRGRALYYYGGWGFIDKSGRRITERQYTSCSGFKYADTSIVREIAPYGNGEFAAIHSAIIDLDGNLLTPLMLGEMHYNSDGFYVLSGGMRPNIYEEEFYYQDGTKMPYSSICKYDGDGYFVKLNGGDRIYDKIIGEIVSASDGREFEIFEVYGTDSGDLRLYGIKNKNGEVLVDAVFNYLTEIGVNYLAVQGDYGGLIDVNGNWIIKVTILDDSTASEHKEKDPKTDYEYTIENNEATITKYIAEGTTPVIPYEIDGIKVTAIGKDAFRGCKGITSVEIPNSVTSIGNSAFYECRGLKEITIPNSVTYIGNAAFFRCESLTNIDIPNSVTCIDKEAFESCRGLKEIIIPNSVTSIEWATFAYCTGLTSVTIPDSVTNIGDNAFMGCTALKSITIPKSVITIGREAFYNCKGLTDIIIPESVTSIDEYAFNYCSSLKSVKIPNGVTSIGHFAFSDCSSLVSVILPNSLISIGQGAFCDCTSLTSIEIPSRVTSIEYLTFSDCTSLKSVTIPDSVTSIGKYAFSGCKSLTDLRMQKKERTISDNAFEGTPVQGFPWD